MSKIQWTDVTLSCVTGCTKTSEGCRSCYAEKLTYRLQRMYEAKLRKYEDPGELSKYRDGFHNVKVFPKAFDKVKSWKKPRKIFLNSMSDTFHENVLDYNIRWMFKMMRFYNDHQWQVLTKRSKRLLKLNTELIWASNVWMGVSVESDKHLDRIDHLRQTDAKVKFLSLEPLLSPLPDLNLEGIDQVIIGAESGSSRRPMLDGWVREIIEQCKKFQVAIFYKQQFIDGKKVSCPEIDGRQYMEFPKGVE